MKSREMILCMALWLMALGANAFPSPTECQEKKFEMLYSECERVELLPETRLSGDSMIVFRLPAYRELDKFGLEVLELIYRKCKQKNANNMLEKRVLMQLWASNTHKYGVKVPPDIWSGESIETVWEGGWELFRERVNFLLSEMRMAEKDGRPEDCSRAQDAIAGLGIFAFPFVFSELEKGHDDAIGVLRRVSWRSKIWEKSNVPSAFDRQTLLDWWAANKKAYELPRQSPDIKGSADLWKWKRTGK